MKRVWIVLTLLALIAFTGWGLVRLMRPGQGAPGPTSIERSTDQGRVAAQTAARGVVDALPRGDFDSVRPELETLARAGDARAAYRLGITMARCRDYRPMPGGVLAETLGRAMHVFGSGLKIYGSTLDDDRVLDTMLHTKAEQDQLCGGAAGVRGQDTADQAQRWLEMAAMAGHTRAMSEYGRHAFDEFDSSSSVFDNADEVLRRRERARGFLQQALEAGEPEALAVLAQAHGPFAYLDANRVDSLAYWYAYLQTAPGRRLPGGMVSLLQENFERDLSDGERAQARVRGQEILRRFADRARVQ